jgi:tetratricopeptide (TPR) repeat protein
MDEHRLLKACELADKGKYSEAHNEFIQLAEDTPDPLEKAWPLIYAANTLQAMGQQEAASVQLSAARTLIEEHRPLISARDEKFAAIACFLDFEDANLLWLRSGDLEVALNRFDAALKKHRLAFKDPRSRSLHEAIQIRRAFILADLGRWKETLPILEGIKSPQEYREGIAFYLGHCYLSGDEYERAKHKLTEALRLGLPTSLEYRAHCELGMTYYNLKDYAKAKQELETGAEHADANYIKESNIWKWLEMTCRAMGLQAEAELYVCRARPS